ncbi:MAG: CO dehydrogenase/acetyl-CoA synthase subunit delta [Candidatus Bathyarchaeia archaeon]
MVEKRKNSPFDLNLLEALARLQEVEFKDIEISFEELELNLIPRLLGIPKQIPTLAKKLEAKTKPTEIMEAEYQIPLEEYSSQIVEVKLGGTKTEGGTRSRSITIGGEKAPAFFSFLEKMPNKPVIAIDVFDYPQVRLPKAVKMHVSEVIDDPAEWARLCVDKFEADMINVHLLSIDPLINNTTAREAVKTVENVLQAVDVPIAIGGCGDPKKDLEVFTEIAAAAEGERLLFGSVTLDMDIEATAKIIQKHDHTVIAFTSMDVNKARELNRKLYEHLDKDRIVMDTTTAALGYGLDYAFTVMERARLAGLKGDLELNHPISSGSTNAWAAREAWLQLGPEWSPRELRGPLWETITAQTLLLAGVDYFMMMHPASVKALHMMIESLVSDLHPTQIGDWITLK